MNVRASLRARLPALVAGLGCGMALAAPPAEGVAAAAAGQLRLQSFHVDEQGRLSAGLLDGAGAQQTWTLASCAEAFAAVRARRPPRSVGTAEFPLQIGWGEVSHRGQRLIDAASDHCEDTRRDAPAQVAQQLALLSLTGPLLAWRIERSEARAGGPPYHRETWHTRDLRTGRPVDLRDVFEPEGLHAALRADRVLQRWLGARRLANASLDALLATIAGEGGEALPFAIHHIDPADGRTVERVAVRVAVRPAGECGLCPNRVTQLGLWLQPRAAWRDHLTAATAAAGFTMNSRFDQREP